MMGVQYFCQNKRRRQAVDDHPSLNGIDYLEVLDLDAPAGFPKQQTLLIRFLKALPAGLDADNVSIEGGMRVTPVAVEWAVLATDVAELNPPQPDHVLVVRTNVSGDFSTYRFRLVTSPTSPEPPNGFDRILSEVEFSFKVECPSDFDCPEDAPCPPEVDDEPVLDHLAKDYASFRQLILDRLAIIMPDWQERNPSDQGIALVELLAYAGDYLSYFQDAAATEAYLGTARRRTSLRRHARLLDYPMHDGCNARTWVSFQVDDQGDGLLLPKSDPITGNPTRLLTRMPESAVVPEAELDEVLSKNRTEIFELMEDVLLHKAHNDFPFYTWGDEECCLPAGATQATLEDDEGKRLLLRSGDVLIFEERYDPGTGQRADADPTRRHAVRLKRVHPQATVDALGVRSPGLLVKDELFNQAIVEIEWDVADALPFPLCLSAVVNGELLAATSIALGNVALVDHGRTIAGETIEPPSGHLRHRPRLQETNITYRQPRPVPQSALFSATSTILQDPRKALPAVQLSGEGEIWQPQRDLLNSDRFATEFVVEMESDGRGQLRFGDGIYGREPATSALQASYRIGNGSAGNVGADAIAHVVTDVDGITGVRNPLPAYGGTEAESMEEVRQYAPQAFRTQERAVTAADYAAVAERHPEVQKAMATRRWTGSWHTMFITVDRREGRPVDAEFEEAMRSHLERFRMAGHDIEIDAPLFVPLDIILTVCVSPGYFQSDVKQALLEVLGSRRMADGRLGYFHPDNFTFGQPVYLSQIIATVMDVPGVQWVDADDSDGKANRFQRWGRRANGEIKDGLIEMDRLEIARLDNDPNQRENGKLEFIMEGGL